MKNYINVPKNIFCVLASKCQKKNKKTIQKRYTIYLNDYEMVKIVGNI